MHALGFYHEHQRPDRDNYIKINWSAVGQDVESQFLKIDQRYLKSTSSFLTEYDSLSIMHYDSFGNGVFRTPVMVKLDGSIIKPNTEMSYFDTVTLNKMYPCDNACDNKDMQSKTKFI